MRRRDVKFISGVDTCAAWLYPPAGGGSDGTVPLIVMVHGLTGTRRDRLGPFAERFADAGVAALVFDHRGFGDSTGELDRVDPALQLEDWRAAIEAAAAAGDHLPAVGQPHEAAFINVPGAEAGWRHVVSIGEDSRWRSRALAGWLLGGYSPIRHVATLHCPWLVCVAEEDNVARPGPAIAAGRRAPGGEVRTYRGVGHFDIYDGPEHVAVVADEVEFHRRHLLPAT